jgi:hypothetical protein
MMLHVENTKVGEALERFNDKAEAIAVANILRSCQRHGERAGEER